MPPPGSSTSELPTRSAVITQIVMNITTSSRNIPTTHNKPFNPITFVCFFLIVIQRRVGVNVIFSTSASSLSLRGISQVDAGRVRVKDEKVHRSEERRVGKAGTSSGGV